MCKMIEHTKPLCIYELFEHDKNYASREKNRFKRKMQFLFLVLINKLQMLVVVRSLKWNYNAFHRNADEILAKCEKALDKDLLTQLKRVLNNNDLSKCEGHTTAVQRIENRAYRNHSSVKKRKSK